MGAVQDGGEGVTEYNFTDVMRQWRRMCKAFSETPDCEGCPIEDMTEHGCDGIYSDEFADVVDWNEFARRVMQWAEENPEPVYPTWLEWLTEIGVFEQILSGDYRYYVCGKPLCAIPTENIFKPMPQEYAEKLGLKPKEGTS